MRIDIKDVHGYVLFSYDCIDNSVKKTLEIAVSKNVKLYYADLESVNLYKADLKHAYLYGANLQNSNLQYTNLYKADLQYAILDGANLSYGMLRYANLVGAKLRSVDLTRSELLCTNLNSATLVNADLTDIKMFNAQIHNARLDLAKNIPYIPLACPSEGSFIGWKKVNGCLIKLLIPSDAKRSSATTNKCRCDKAKVLEIINLKTSARVNEVINDNYAECIYKVNEMVYPDYFDEYRWNECSNGIHFFINKLEAINY